MDQPRTADGPHLLTPDITGLVQTGTSRVDLDPRRVIPACRTDGAHNRQTMPVRGIIGHHERWATPGRLAPDGIAEIDSQISPRRMGSAIP